MMLSSSNIIIAFIYTVIFVFGSIGNILIILYYGFYKKRKALYHIYLINLAVADLICSVFYPVGYVSSTFTTWFMNLHIIPRILIYAISPLTVNVSAWIIVSIAYERYRGIVTPYKPRLTKVRIHIMVLVIWLTSIINIIHNILAAEYGTGCSTSANCNKYYKFASAIVILISQSIFPIVFLAFAVNGILNAFNKGVKMQTKASSSNKKQKRTIRILIVTLFVFTVCTLPYNIYSAVVVFMNGKGLIELQIWLTVLLISNSVMNCWIYAGMDIAFRRYCFSLFKQGKAKNENIGCNYAVNKEETNQSVELL